MNGKMGGMALMIAKRLLYFTMCIVWALLIPLSAIGHAEKPATEGAAEKNAVIIAIPGLTFNELRDEDLAMLANIRWLTEHAAMGALNVRTPERGLEDSYISLGAGAPAVSDSLVQAWESEERLSSGVKAADLYRRYQGRFDEDAKIVVPEIAALRQMNETKHYGASIGALGETLAQHGVHVRVYGNLDRGMAVGSSSADGTDTVHGTGSGKVTDSVHGSDSADGMDSVYGPSSANDMSLAHDKGLAHANAIETQRYASLMLMESAGTLQDGEIGANTLIYDVSRPYSVKTDYGMLFDHWKQSVEPRPSATLFELGDLDRLFTQKNLFSAERFTRLRQIILREIDGFIGRWLKEAQHDPQTSVWIISPIANAVAMSDKAMLTPIFQYERGINEGLIVSGTTRRSGIAANYDVAPSILKYFHIQPPDSMVGQALGWQPHANALGSLRQQLDEIKNIYILRPKLLVGLVFYEVIVLLVSLWVALKSRRVHSRWMMLPLLSILISPIILLIMGLAAHLERYAVIVWFILLLGLISWLAARLSLLASLCLIGLGVGFGIILDGFTGSNLMKQSVLGYDPMIGARYYGIGNEFMGVLIGALVLGTTAVLQLRSWKKRQFIRFSILISLVYLVTAIYLASPILGTNAGGALTAAAAFGIAWMRMFGGHWLHDLKIGKLVILLLTLMVVGLVGLGLLNVVLVADVQQQSHIGRAMKMLLMGRFDVIWDIVLRKLQMNLHLIGVSNWSKVLMTSLFVMVVIVVKPWGVFRRWQERYPYLMYGFSANVVGSLVTLLVNDSGIVAAATMIVYVAVPMLLLKLYEQPEHALGPQPIKLT